jgi:hypothetical protein
MSGTSPRSSCTRRVVPHLAYRPQDRPDALPPVFGGDGPDELLAAEAPKRRPVGAAAGPPKFTFGS